MLHPLVNTCIIPGLLFYFCGSGKVAAAKMENPPPASVEMR